MAEAIVSLAIETLDGLILQEGRTLSGGRDQLIPEIENARGLLAAIRAVLIDADAIRSNDELLSFWVAQVKEAACDLEDVIASYLLKEASRRNGSSVKKIIAYACIDPFDVRKTDSEIKRISSHLSDLNSKLTRYGLVSRLREDNESVTTVGRLRRTYAHDSKRLLVGLEEDVCILVEHLVGEENSPRVVSVWGTGGMGKTTIAKQVYNDDEVRRHFDCFAWVYVSQKFQSRDVLEEILVKLTCPNSEGRSKIARMNVEEIVTELYTIQQERRCLVVIDDIWSCQAWDSLKPGFPREKTKTKILLTTRNREVALYADRDVFLYEARPLMMDESWMLFENIAIAGRDDSADFMEILGKKMVQSCRGLPLAIIVLAGLLARKNTVGEWTNVSEIVGAYLAGDRHIESQYEGTSWVLALSYDNLPKRLQICFQFLGNFPEDYEIPVKTLIQLWMAEGLIASISSESAESIEDTSYGYLNELIKRCMVQVVEQSLTGNIKTIRLHDLMLELCRKKAERENFLHIVNSSEATQTQDASCGRVRRLAVHLDGIGHELAPPSDERHASLRSLLFFVQGHYYSDIFRKLLRSLCQDFKLLRVLKFEDMKAEPEVELPSNIGNLVHLRFLSLKNSEIKRLPSSLANLVRLQTLDLRSVEWVSVKIPNVFQKMAQLRHLYLPLNHRVTEKLSLATLHKLQTLVNISSQDCDLKDLIELTGLRKLVLHARESIEFKTLEDIMRARSSTFGHLRSLSLVAETMVFSEGGFRQLEHLSLLGLCELKEWAVARGAMPILSSLHIRYCWGLRAVPDGLQYILTLKNLSINQMYRQFCNRLEKGGEDFDKVKHASVTITDSR